MLRQKNKNKPPLSLRKCEKTSANGGVWHAGVPTTPEKASNVEDGEHCKKSYHTLSSGSSVRGGKEM